MTLQEAIQHCRKQVQEQAKKGCYSCAEEHQQLAEWLKELKAYRDARAEINQALYDDARGEQNDYERGRKSGIFLCESIISVKLGESRSEIPNKWIPVSDRLPEKATKVLASWVYVPTGAKYIEVTEKYGNDDDYFFISADGVTNRDPILRLSWKVQSIEAALVDDDVSVLT